ncbi:MAG: HEAT repeat domain-containing protein, partial [Planctomycetes bacterium]|nr:HEAT repeat domain-containing protein [Planctomycetota bacterium]
ELAIALASIAPGDERTLATLLDRLRRNEFPALSWKGRTVWNAFGGHAVVGLAGLLKHENDRVRSRAGHFLWQMTLKDAPRAESAVPVLIELLGEKERRDTAADLLADIGPPARAALFRLEALLANRNPGDDLTDVARAVALIAPGNETAIKVLIGELKHDDPKRREWAAWDLQRIGQSASAAVPPLIACLDDENPPVRRHATDALGAMGSAAKSAIPALVAARYDEYEPDEVWGSEGSVYALGEIGPDALPSLLELLRDEMLGGKAAGALGLMGPAAEPAVDELLGLLSEGKHPATVAATLGEIGRGATKAVPALQKLLKDKCRYVRHAASEALENIGG